MPDFVARTATHADVSALTALVNSAYRGESSRAGWTTEADLLGGQRIDEGQLLELIARPGNVVLIHERDGTPVACVQLTRTGEDECYLGMMTVSPTLQRAGIGSRLMADAERWAAANWGVRHVQMTVIVQRSELISWYERRGYLRTGQTKPFPYGDERFGLPKRDDLSFVVLGKTLPIERGTRVDIAPGVVHFRHYLRPEAQQALVAECQALMDGAVPAYVPTVRGGGKMHVRMLCLGRHWNGQTYRYESTRTDYDGLPAPPLPDFFKDLADVIADEAGMMLDADLCILNYYDAEGRMGLHQDKDESPESIAAGFPVVSISLGDSARFLFGGLKRKDPVEPILLESGDAFVFGGESRLRYHGVSRIVPGSAPPELGLAGRFNLTFRQYGA